MYRAKEAGKGQSRVWSPEMHPASLGRAPRHDEIAAALEAGELVAHFQPIVSIATGEVVAAEALARWEHPRHGLLGPSAFVGAAEATGQVVGIDRAVLEHACFVAASWDGWTGGCRAAPPCMRTCRASGCGPSRSWARSRTCSRAPASTRRGSCSRSPRACWWPISRWRAGALSALRDLGVQIALDDFGTGHSSLQSLRELPVDVIKVAKPFVDGAARSPHDRALMRMMIEMGELFGVAVVAEGIEREDQLRVLRELGCGMGQGYLLGRPVEMPAGLPHAAVLGG